MLVQHTERDALIAAALTDLAVWPILADWLAEHGEDAPFVRAVALALDIDDEDARPSALATAIGATISPDESFGGALVHGAPELYGQDAFGEQLAMPAVRDRTRVYCYTSEDVLGVLCGLAIDRLEYFRDTGEAHLPAVERSVFFLDGEDEMADYRRIGTAWTLAEAQALAARRGLLAVPGTWQTKHSGYWFVQARTWEQAALACADALWGQPTPRMLATYPPALDAGQYYVRASVSYGSDAGRSYHMMGSPHVELEWREGDDIVAILIGLEAGCRWSQVGEAEQGVRGWVQLTYEQDGTEDEASTWEVTDRFSPDAEAPPPVLEALAVACQAWRAAR